ncbi:MAG: hydrolase [Rhodospirillaceae bacterium]|nr:hydrolase [Rhodospirillaceae bacterium]
MRITADRSCLVIVDVQERLAPVMGNPRKVIDGASRLVDAASRLEVPTLISEQYPKGLGPTMIDVREVMPDETVYVSKVSFSCLGEPVFVDKFEALNRRQVVVAGIELHVCVMQTALDLKAKGYDVFVVVDACGSRFPEDEEIAKLRLTATGIHLVTIEMVIFEWLERSGTPAFKTITKTLIR